MVRVLLCQTRMHKLPAVVAHRSPFDISSTLGCVSFLIFCIFLSFMLAETAVASNKPEGVQSLKDFDVDNPQARPAVGRVANITAHTEEELMLLMSRAEQVLDEGMAFPQRPAAVFILHGPEVQFFRKANFDQYRSLVEKAAQLDALNIIDVRVCQLYLSRLRIAREQIPAFVEVVSDGPAQERELLHQGYIHF